MNTKPDRAYWREIASQAWCRKSTSGIEMDTRLAKVFASMLQETYKLGVKNATGLLRQDEISKKEEREEGAQWARTYPQETAKVIERILLFPK